MSESISAIRAEVDPDDKQASQAPQAAPRTEPPPGAAERTSDLRTVRRLLWAIVIVMSLGVLYVARVVFIPLVAALLLSLLFKPLVRRLEYAGISPPVSAMLILGAIVLGLAVGGSAVGNSLASWLEAAPRSVQELRIKLESVRGTMLQVSQAQDQIEDMTDGDDTPLSEPVEVKVRESAVPTTALGLTTAIVAGLVFTLAIAFFLLASGDLLLRQLVQALPSLTDKKEAVEAIHDLESHVSAYLITVTLINAGLGGVVWLSLWLLGVPHAMWWGITAGAANFIPYVGPLVAAVLIFAASVLAFDTLSHALLPPAVFITITSIEGYLVTPTVLGRRLSLNPLVVFIWLIFWGWMWGVAGALLAVPMLVCVKIVCDHVESLELASRVLSGYVRPLREVQEEREAAPPADAGGVKAAPAAE